jgi:hypothetical protein
MTDPITSAGSDPSTVWNAINSIAAIGAAALGGVALWKQRTPRPHWNCLEPTRVHTTEATSGGASPIISWHQKDVYTWYLRAEQNGPGDAERVKIFFRQPNGPWVEIDFREHVKRGEVVAVKVWEDVQLPEGKYGLKLVYRCLPDTTKERTWVGNMDHRA